ncbi:amidase [Pseudomonas sp. LS1212]|uniref:amidase n=1 Tax=Pseudomonas sp. LS1212 TaxID=2972478 RepID=UPI00215BDC2F|nr:amidase [Pseudomonas sp. LS1212]UVJ43188.1 amidase [Pseudomonas sp. LS1212]
MRRLGLLLVLAVVALIWHERLALQAFPGILSAYSAKEFCSCRYVMNHSTEYCLGYVKQYLPLSGLLDEPEHKRVTARGLGQSNSAAWIGPRQGCRLLP